MTTCLVDGLFPDVAAATVVVLQRLGVDVAVPRRQSCCGQVFVNSGYPELALGLIRKAVDDLRGYDAVVVPSGSCAGTVRHQYAALCRRAADEQLRAAVEELASRTYELSEFVVDVLGAVDVGARFPHSVAYHPTCHSMRVLGVGERPLRLLERVRDIELVELPDAHTCCGFGGTFAVKNSDTSGAMLADKLAGIAASGCDVVCASDSSCLMHIEGGLRRLRGGAARPVHLAEILAAT